jgi:hypothetical protein
MSPKRFSVTSTSNSAGRGDQLHRRVVHQQVVELDLLVLGREPRDRLPPEREVSITFALSTEVSWPGARRRLEADSGDPLDLLDRVRAVVVGAVAVARRVAEVDAAGELADDQQVGALDPLALSGLASSSASLGRPGAGCEQPSPCAGPSSPARRRACPDRSCPTWAADGAEQHRVGLAAGLERLVGERVPYSSIEAPPIRCSVISKSPRTSSTRLAAAAISGPMPSPGRRTIRSGIGPARRDVQANVVEDERIVLELQHRLCERAA